jgi:hypothetical protein
MINASNVYGIAETDRVRGNFPRTEHAPLWKKLLRLFLSSISTTIEALSCRTCAKTRPTRVRSRTSHASHITSGLYGHTFHLKGFYCGPYSNFDSFTATFADAPYSFVLFGETPGVLDKAAKPP